MISDDDVRAAAGRIAGYVRRTPSLALDEGVVLKLELTQHTGSFKPRGAFNEVLGAAHASDGQAAGRPPTGLPAAGLVAASGGNHGQAVAYVGQRLGVPVEVYVPEVCPEVKRRRIASLGATVVVGGAIYDDAQLACSARAVETGAMLVHPFDADAVMAGAGTVALELEQDHPDLDTVLVAVGGGGLLGGTLAWLGSRIKVVAVEPTMSSALHAALAAGAPVDVEVAGVAADSLGSRRIGSRPFELARRHLAASVTVPDAHIVDAQRALWDRCRLVAEPGGATALAALLGGSYRPAAGERVGVIVCGANVDPSTVGAP